YNTSGYEREWTLSLLDGVVDIWLPDAKYADDAIARRLSGFRNYAHNNRAALREMYRQTGPELALASNGLAVRGMIVRHMILPEGLAGTPQVLNWLARELSPQVHISLMDQYFPAHHALRDPILGRKTTEAEYLAALDAF
ncbi:MAG: radical SAM protein, partial [Anaerolineae bacterium]|nr:radical SAM protein [Anaerolineae bacterium]